MTLVFKSGLLLLVSGEGGGNRGLEMQLSEGYPWLQNLGEGSLMPRPLGRDRVGRRLFSGSPDHKSLALVACNPKEKFADVG